jgi:hypothetical protein
LNNRSICFTGRQHCIKLLRQSALDGHDVVAPVKIEETKGCNVFCVGFIRQTQTSCLCVAIKRTIQVYDLIYNYDFPGTYQHCLKSRISWSSGQNL